MNKIAIYLIALFSINVSIAQDIIEEPEFRNPPFSLGLGLGLDYGGFGAKATYIVANRVGLFAGLGYNFNGAGYNFGAAVRILPDKRVTPYFSVMYGYNAVINVSGNIEFKETYYGATVGAGIELKSKRQPNFWNFGLLLPFRDAAYQNKLDELKFNGVDFSSEPWPIGISIGYHFGLK